MSSVSTLYEFAAELLEEAVQALSTTVAGAPSRAFVAASLPALDCCPQLTVHLQGLSLEGTEPVSPGPVVGHRIFQGHLNLATYVVTIVRCTPQPTGASLNPPDVLELESLSAVVMEDLWSIWNHLSNIIREGMIFEGKCMAVYFDATTPVDESGGCAGWTFTVRVAVSGYTEGS